jgi:nitrogen fixation-related uncharacterized protein
MSILLLMIFLGFLIWGIKSKQFRNIEEAKYQLFDKTEKEEEPPELNRNTGEGDRKC